MDSLYKAKVDSLNPVVHWRLNETAGTTVADRVGGLDGTYVGGVQLGAEGVVGDGAARFDGSNDRAVAEPQEVMELPVGTIEMWVTPASVDGQQMLFSNNRPGRQAGDLEIQLMDDQVLVGIQGDGTQHAVSSDASGFQAAAGTPFHLALSFGAGGLNLFLDGALAASDPFTGGLVGNDETVAIGARGDGSLAFQGTIDEFVFYDRALAADDVGELFAAGREEPVADPGDGAPPADPDQGGGSVPDDVPPVAGYGAVVESLDPTVHWRFDETAGTTATDHANGLDGTYVGGVQLGAEGVAGDGAARFDGVDDRMAVTAAPLGAVTVAAFGDSLTAGNGVGNPSQYFDAELERALEARGLDATVLNRGVSGETTSAALARVDDVIGEDPDIVIVELGTNDAIGTAPQATVENNLRSMITDFDEAGIDVLLTSAFAYYPDFNGGRGYGDEGARDDFEAIFPGLAQELDVELLDAGGSNQFLGGTREGTVITGGVLGDSSLSGDRLHPNAQGVDEIVGRIAPQVADMAPLGANPLAQADGTVEMWVTPASVDGHQMLFSNNRPGPQAGDLEIQLIGDQVLVGIQDDGTHTVRSDANGFQAAADTPFHLALSFGTGGMNLFLDGALAASDPFTGGLVGSSETASIGARGDGSLPFQGVIDELVVYDRALAASEVGDLYEAGARGGQQGDAVVAGGGGGEALRIADLIDGVDADADAVGELGATTGGSTVVTGAGGAGAAPPAALDSLVPVQPVDDGSIVSA